jgi:hypothetical protein
VLFTIGDTFDKRIDTSDGKNGKRTWHLNIQENLQGKWYGYVSNFIRKDKPVNTLSNEIFADPYSRM